MLAAESGSPPDAADGLLGTNSNADEEQGVFAIYNGHAIFVPVKTGIMGTMNVEVLKGLQPGDEIVTGSYSVLRTLKNGAKVRIDNRAPANFNEGSSGSS